MDVSSTAQTAPIAATLAAATLPWWKAIIGAVIGWFGHKYAPAVQQGLNSAQVKTALQDVKALAPAAEAVATLSGNPALAGGIESASKIADAVSQTQDPTQLATLAIMHAQALAAAAPAPAPKA